jgi:NADH-quinone oxidoreductase subunit L
MTAGFFVVLGLFLPAWGFLYTRLFGAGQRNLVRMVGPGTALGAFLCFAIATVETGGRAVNEVIYTWAPAGHGLGALPAIDADFRFDPLAAVMTLVVTGVGSLIHVYSVGYMADEDDAAFARFFGHMNLFIFSMLILVLAANFLFLVVGWAMVGLSSYLLIGFWRQRPAAVNAARKAFVMNVIGDVGIVIAGFLAVRAVGSLEFFDLFNARIGNMPGPLPPLTVELIAFLLLVGAVAKSAQIPLHTWLPDAMEGPTPVSALIHAATMVTAGVYLIARFEPIFLHAPAAATTAAWIGLLTAAMAALVATVQTDIKRVLAYSTMSQIGYMFFAVSIGAEAAGIFHLVTHAFFKALLFLAAGNVIHALHGEQDLRKMGGLRKHIPRTADAFLIGSLALAGVPPLAGFFSKDEIIRAGVVAGPLAPLGGLLLIAVAGLTAFYMLRAYVLAFGGPDPGAQTHEAPSVMSVPVMVLAGLAVLGGLIQPGPWQLLGDFLRAGQPGLPLREPSMPLVAGLVLAGAALLLVAAGTVVAVNRFGRAGVRERIRDPATSRGPLARAFYWDAVYEATVVQPLWALGDGLERFFERPVAIGLLDLAGRATRAAGGLVRRLQSGYLRGYAAAFAVATLVVVVAVGLGIR